jgi:hypothetical protein
MQERQGKQEGPNKEIDKRAWSSREPRHSEGLQSDVCSDQKFNFSVSSFQTPEFLVSSF